jgi:hypothetical protein
MAEMIALEAQVKSVTTQHLAPLIAMMDRVTEQFP